MSNSESVLLKTHSSWALALAGLQATQPQAEGHTDSDIQILSIQKIEVIHWSSSATSSMRHCVRYQQLCGSHTSPKVCDVKTGANRTPRRLLQDPVACTPVLVTNTVFHSIRRFHYPRRLQVMAPLTS